METADEDGTILVEAATGIIPLSAVTLLMEAPTICRRCAGLRRGEAVVDAVGTGKVEAEDAPHRTTSVTEAARTPEVPDMVEVAMEPREGLDTAIMGVRTAEARLEGGVRLTAVSATCMEAPEVHRRSNLALRIVVVVVVGSLPVKPFVRSLALSTLWTAM